MTEFTLKLVHPPRPEHLTEVVAEMRGLGAPTIRAVWNRTMARWYAVEGVHRAHAAQALGLAPNLISLSWGQAAEFLVETTDYPWTAVDLQREYMSVHSGASLVFNGNPPCACYHAPEQHWHPTEGCEVLGCPCHHSEGRHLTTSPNRTTKESR